MSPEDHYWHGINAVALTARAARDGLKKVDGVSRFQFKTAARRIQAQMKAQGDQADIWQIATAAEAAVALGDLDAARDWIIRYTSKGGADAFEFASTLRQFKDVWQLDDRDPQQALILQLLRTALLDAEGGQVELATPQRELSMAREMLANPTLEKVLGADRYKSYRWYATGLARAARVGKVCDSFGAGMGTGFLLPAQAVHPSIQGWVFVTNAHVISEDPAEQAGSPASLPPQAARIKFEAADAEGTEHHVAQVLFSSPRSRLDCTIVTLAAGPDAAEEIPTAANLPLLGKNQRVYVIGHPRGGGLSFSLADNLLLDHEAPKIHYRAPTEGGSSGSRRPGADGWRCDGATRGGKGGRWNRLRDRRPWVQADRCGGGAEAARGRSRGVGRCGGRLRPSRVRLRRTVHGDARLAGWRRAFRHESRPDFADAGRRLAGDRSDAGRR